MQSRNDATRAGFTLAELPFDGLRAVRKRERRAFTLIELLVVVAVISILAAMLLPALSSAREKSRRASCMTSLKQMALGVEAYSGDYSGYLPSNHAWGSEYWDGTTHVREAEGASGKVTGTDRGWFYDNKDTTGTGRVGTSGGYLETPSTLRLSYYLFPSQFHLIARGERAGGHRTATAPLFPQTAGALSAGPTGLGFLVTGGYMADVRPLYCPSASGMHMLYSDTGFSSILGVNSLRDFHTLGGFDGFSLTHGDYRAVLDRKKVTGVTSFTDWIGNGYMPSWAECSYAYRNAPLLNPKGYGSIALGATEPAGYGPATSPASFPGVRPAIDMTMTGTAYRTKLGQPVFKTTRALGGRALVSDVFGKNSNMGGYSTINNKRGAALKAHVDGYNVLYGDGHAAWYGDPQQKMIWQRYQGTDAFALSTDYTKFVEGLGPAWLDPLFNNGFINYHAFDEAAGVDSGVWALP